MKTFRAPFEVNNINEDIGIKEVKFGALDEATPAMTFKSVQVISFHRKSRRFKKRSFPSKLFRIHADGHVQEIVADVVPTSAKRPNKKIFKSRKRRCRPLSPHF